MIKKRPIRDKKGAILVGNIIFILLNLTFLIILTVFLLRYSSGESLLEENYAKQIALILDSAKPKMQVFLNMEDAFKIAEEKWGKENLERVVKIDGNRVIVRLTEESKGASYSFFNNINIDGYYNLEKGYVFNLGGYK